MTVFARLCAALFATAYLALLPAGPLVAGQSAPYELSSKSAVQGGIVYGKLNVDGQIFLDDRSVPVSEDGFFFLAFHYNAQPSAALRVVTAQGDIYTHTIAVEPRTFKVERIDGLPPGKVTAPPERQKRIAKEAAKKRAARAQKGMHLSWAEGFIDPVERYRLSGFYGSQRILNGVPKRPHYGLDFAAPTGTPVMAPAGGVVTLAEDDFWYEGGLIFLDHGHGLQSAFLHLSDVTVKPGDVVRQGDVIGAVGAAGRATGPHLDWRVNWGKVWIDPMVLLKTPPLAAYQQAAGDAPQ
jgi:murein DD-endopeptidase MepM/ murein hydrolase activator NlpD